MSALALRHNSVNLGQGFPDQDGAPDVREVAARALLEQSNQYPPMYGMQALRTAIAKHDQRFYETSLDPSSQILVTSGATEALTASILALVNPGDEVILFEPLYDTYLPMVRFVGGVPKLVRLNPPDWHLPFDDLERAFSPKTKLILYNSPMNPTGKVFSKQEIEKIVALAAHFDAYIVADEVYEHLVFDARKHFSVLSFGQAKNRAVRIGSAGKIFALTGWKVGFCVGAPDIITRLARVHQFLTFTTPPHLQIAVAYGLMKEDHFFSQQIKDMQGKRDSLTEKLKKLQFDVLPTEGTFFLTAKFDQIAKALNFQGSDHDFCIYLTEKAHVTAIPFGAFYDEDPEKNYIRFCFAKSENVLENAYQNLHNFLHGRL